MANAYRDYERERGGYREGRYGQRGSSGGPGGGRSSGRPSDRENEYFGGGGMQYGEGYSGGSERDNETYSRNYEGGPTYERSRYSRSYEPDEETQSSYSQGFGSEASRRHSGIGYSGRSGYGGGYGRGSYANRYSGHGAEDLGYGYGRGYPESEQGFENYEGGERGWWDKTSDEVASWFGDEEASRRRRQDQRRGPHRGRGPTSYTRSDERIKDDVNDRLTEHSYLDASNIEVQTENGEVTLTGTVDNRYEKRLAEDVAEDVSGVKNVENRIRVKDTSSATTQNTSTSYDASSGTSSRSARTSG
jgi:osmotically-inducible protein OsmY